MPRSKVLEGSWFVDSSTISYTAAHDNRGIPSGTSAHSALHSNDANCSLFDTEFVVETREPSAHALFQNQRRVCSRLQIDRGERRSNDSCRLGGQSRSGGGGRRIDIQTALRRDRAGVGAQGKDRRDQVLWYYSAVA